MKAAQPYFQFRSANNRKGPPRSSVYPQLFKRLGLLAALMTGSAASAQSPARGVDAAGPQMPLAGGVGLTLRTTLMSGSTVADQARERFISLELPLLVNDAYVGDIGAEVTMSGKARIQRNRLFDLLAHRISEDLRARLADADPTAGHSAAQRPGESDKRAVIALETLRARGLDIRYDSSALTIKILLSPDQKSTSVIQLRRQRIAGPNGATPENEFAGGVSFNFRTAYAHATSSNTSKLEKLGLDYRGFFSFGGFNGASLAFAGDYEKDRKEPWELRDLTLIRDDYRRGLRFQFGTFRPRDPSRFAGTQDFVGLSIERDLRSIQPFKNLRPSGATSFTLERPALVTIEVNGAVVSATELDAGSYNISDFPFVNGANDVRILVRDDFGVRELANFNNYINTNLLAGGEVLFGVSGGVIAGNDSNSVWSVSDQWGSNGFIEYGVNEQWTSGMSFQTVGDAAQVSMTNVFGVKIGVIATEAAATFGGGRSTGYAGGVLYSWRSQPGRAGLTQQISVQQLIRGRNFSPISQPASPVADEQSTNYVTLAQYNVQKGRFTINAAYSRSQNGDQVTDTKGLTGTARFLDNTISVRLQNRTDNGDSENSVFVSLSRRFGTHRLRSRYATKNNEADIQWSRPSARRLNEWGGNLLLNRDDDAKEIDARAVFTGSRAEIDIAHRTEQTAFGRSSTTQTNLGVGVGFAGDRAAFGRPFDDGFVIVSAHPTLKDRPVAVRRTFQGGRVEAKTGYWGAALYPLRGSYRQTRLFAEVENLPIGYSLGESQVVAFPSARAGYAFLVGTDASNTVIGNLIRTDNGQPLALAVGVVTPTGDEEPEEDQAIQYFTNRTGRIVVEGLKPGHYDIRLGAEGTKIGGFEIPKDVDGLVRLEEIPVTLEQ